MEKFQPSVGGEHITQKFSDKFTASGVAEQTVWWAGKTAAIIKQLTAQYREATTKLERAEVKLKEAALNKEAAAKLEKAEAKWKEATGKVAHLEGQLKEAAVILCCSPENIAEGIKDKIRICNTVEDFQIQAKKD